MERVLLPDSVEPIAYSLTLTPDLKAFTFDGVVDIDIAVTMSGTSTIELHARDLYIIPGKTTYTPAGGNSITAIGHSLTYKPPTMKVSFGEDLPEGGGTLHIEFRGELNDQMAGFYRSKYVTVEGEEKYMASSLYENRLRALHKRRKRAARVMK